MPKTDIFGLVDDIEPAQIPKERDVFGLVQDIPASIPIVKTWEDVQETFTPVLKSDEQVRVRNAISISSTHDIPFEAAYDTTKEFIEREKRPSLFEYAGRSFVAGIGDIYVNMGNVFKWGKIPTGGIADTWIDYGKKMQNIHIPADDKPFSYDKLLSPEFYATSVIRSVPSTLSLIPAALFGAEIGIGAGTVMTGRALGAFTKTILGSIGAATLSRPLESAMEASGTYQQAIDSGMPEDEARRAANETFKGNMSLAGLDAAEFATAFMPMKFNTNILALRILSTLGRVGGVAAMEGAEERYQQIVQEMAVNPEAKISDFFTNNPNLNEATAIGAIFGVGLGGAGSVYTAFTDRIVKGFTPEMKVLFDSIVEDNKAEGLTSEEATKKALDEIASTPEGEKEIKDSVGKFKEQAQNITGKADVITEKPITGETYTVAAYHGTLEKFNEFDINKNEAKDNRLMPGVVWFTSHESGAKAFAGDVQTGIAMKRNINFKNPLVVDAKEVVGRELRFKLSNGEYVYDIDYIKQYYIQKAKDSGRDGVIFLNARDANMSGTIYAVFDKNIIEVTTTPEGEKEIKDSVEKFKEQAQNITGKAEVDLITEGIKPPLEVTPKAEAVTEADITEFVESEIVEPEEQLQKAPAGEVTPVVSKDIDEANQTIPILEISTKTEKEDIGFSSSYADEKGNIVLSFTNNESITIPAKERSNYKYVKELIDVESEKYISGKTKNIDTIDDKSLSDIIELLDKKREVYGDDFSIGVRGIYKDEINKTNLLPSNIWEDGIRLKKKLSGTSVIGVIGSYDQSYKEDIGRAILEALEKASIYGNAGRALVVGKLMKDEIFEDIGEIVLGDTQVVAYFDNIPPEVLKDYPDLQSTVPPEIPPTIPPSIPPSEGEGEKKFEGFKVVTPETEGVKTIKQRIRQTTGQVTLANMIREDKALEAAFKKAQQAARAAFRAGNKEGVEAEKVKMKNLFSRAKKIKAVQEFFNLTYADMKTVSRKNPFLMSQYEFKLYLDDVRQKAFELTINKNAKIALKELIRRKNLQKVENLQRALKYPSIDKMSLEQLNNFFDILDQYKKDDVFLSERRLEVVDRTDLKGIKTWREAKEAFAKEAGISVEELGDIAVGQFDKYRYDTALMQRNPFYKMLVAEMHREMMNAEMRHHDIKLEAFRLAKAAETSRPQTLIHKFIPQNKLIMGYIEASADQKAFFLNQMTNEEIDYAHFIEEYFEGALEYLVETQSLTKGRENYFVHMRQGFLENVKEEGLLQAVKNIFKHYKEDEVVFNILDEDTGNILPLEKFFQFSLHRTGGLLPTSNVTEAFLAYSKMFERKASFDKIIPKLDIYAQALTPQKLTPHGLEMDRSLKKFLNQYINNKKGRHIDQFVGKQGGAVDMGLRAIRSLTSLLDLGLNIPVGITAFVGEQVTNFVQLGLNNMTKGAQRALTPHGKAIIQKYEAWLGRSPWEEFTAPGKGITEKIHELLFIGFSESTRISNIEYLLGMITEEEFTSEIITDKRLAELQLEMGRMRVVPGSKSLVGSTSLGSVLTQYKTWAIPIMSTLKGDISTFVTDLSKKPFNEALTTKEARELYRIVGLSSVIIITGAVLAGDDDDNDTSFLGSFKRKFYRESLSLIGALDPTLYTPIRALSFMTDLAKNLKALILLEEKGVKGLEKQLIPKAIRQFQTEKKEFKR